MGQKLTQGAICKNDACLQGELDCRGPYSDALTAGPQE